MEAYSQTLAYINEVKMHSKQAIYTVSYSYSYSCSYSQLQLQLQLQPSLNNTSHNYNSRGANSAQITQLIFNFVTFITAFQFLLYF